MKAEKNPGDCGQLSTTIPKDAIVEVSGSAFRETRGSYRSGFRVTIDDELRISPTMYGLTTRLGMDKGQIMGRIIPIRARGAHCKTSEDS